jgi:hypothetical protein
MAKKARTPAPDTGGHPFRGWLRRNLPVIATLCLPSLILTCGLRWELAATAACIAVLLIPGLALARLLFPKGHPLAAFPASLGTGMAMSLLVFGLPALVALKLHWRLPTFLIAFAVVYVATCAATALLHLRRGIENAYQDEDSAIQFPFGISRITGLILLMAAVLTGLGVARGYSSATHDWLPWTLAGLGGGLLAVAAVCIDRLRAKSRSADPQSSVKVTKTSRISELWLAGILWVAIAGLTIYMMRSAYARPGFDVDDVTYVSQAVDFLNGEPMDRYEPSLGQPIPMAPGFVIGTVPLLATTISWATGIPPAALLHTLFLPMFVLAGVCSLAGLMSVVLGKRGLLVALALSVALLVILKSYDGNRSITNFMIYRAAQPKSVQLMVIAPVQLALLLLTVTRPGRRSVLAAILAAVAGHLVHPWSSAAGALWSGVLVLYALAARRQAFWSTFAVAAAFAVCGLLHQVDARFNFFGVGESSAVTPQIPLELATDESGQVRVRLDPAQSVGAYAYFRLGLLSIPWVLLLGWRNRTIRLVALLGLAGAALCFFEPLTYLLSKVISMSLVWRLRWLVPSAVNAALLGVCVYWAATVMLRRHGDRPAGPFASLAGVVITLGAVVWMLAETPSRWARQMGPVEDLTKCSIISQEIVKEIGGPDTNAYVLAPEPPRCRISHELCQLAPNVRLMMSRKHVIRWFFGEEEMERRLGLLRQFYSGRMSPKDFQQMLERFPFDCVIVDYSQRGGRRQARLLHSLGWTPSKRIFVFELWRAPGKAPSATQ